LVYELVCKPWVYGCQVKADGPEAVKIEPAHKICWKAPTVQYRNPKTKIDFLLSSEPLWRELMEFSVIDRALPNPFVPLDGSSMSFRLAEDLCHDEMDLKRICSAAFQYDMTKCWIKCTPDPETLKRSLSKDLVQ
jgi:hypothetical protein